MVIDYEAARAAFLGCTAFWAPEWVNDPDMFAKMLDDVLVAAGIDDEADDEPTEDDANYWIDTDGCPRRDPEPPHA